MQKINTSAMCWKNVGTFRSLLVVTKILTRCFNLRNPRVEAYKVLLTENRSVEAAMHSRKLGSICYSITIYTVMHSPSALMD